MAWNEPGGDRKNQDPWGSGGGGNRNDGPPDLDEALKKVLEKLGGVFGGGKSGGGGSTGGGLGGGLLLGLVVLLVFLAYQSVYQVNEQDRAVILRFGDYHKTAEPGLNFKIPLVDRIANDQHINVTRVRSVKSQGQMLTEDENIVVVNLTVQYRVADPETFTLKLNDPEKLLLFATDSALRHVVGSSEMHQVLTEGREVMGVEVQSRLQRYLDHYGSDDPNETDLTYGPAFAIAKVNIENVQAPPEVQAAFDDVIKAREDEQKVINQAEAYKNSVIPEARGRAQRMLEESNAYREQVIARAEGESDRFLDLLGAYQISPEVTRQRIYLETLEAVMGDSSKVLVDVDGGNNLMYLPLDKLMQSAGALAVDQVQRQDDMAGDIQALADRVVEELQQRQITSSRRGR